MYVVSRARRWNTNNESKRERERKIAMRFRCARAKRVRMRSQCLHNNKNQTPSVCSVCTVHALQCPQRARSENTNQKSHRWFCLRFDLCELWPNCTRYFGLRWTRKKSRPMWSATNVQYSIVSAASDSSFVGHLPQRVHLKIHRNETTKKRERIRRASPIWQHCLSRVASHSNSSKRARKKSRTKMHLDCGCGTHTHSHTRASAFQLRQTNDTRCCIKPHRNGLNRDGEWL